MMGERRIDQVALFYEFSLDRHVPQGHLLRAIDLSKVRRELVPFDRSALDPSDERRSPPLPGPIRIPKVLAKPRICIPPAWAVGDQLFRSSAMMRSIRTGLHS
jgi:hypothetical protein